MSTVETRERLQRHAGADQSGIGVALIVIGVGLLVIGAGLLVYLGMVVITIINHPGEVELVTLIMKSTQGQGQAFFGQFGDKSFAFSLGEPLRTAIFVLVLLWILGAVANIIKAIIGAGRELVTAGRQR